MSQKYEILNNEQKFETATKLLKNTLDTRLRIYESMISEETYNVWKDKAVQMLRQSREDTPAYWKGDKDKRPEYQVWTANPFGGKQIMASVPFLPRAFDSVQNGGKRAGLRWFRNAPKVGELVHKKATRKAARALGKKKLAAFKQEYKRVEPDGATVFFGDNMQGDRFAGAVLEGGMIRKKNAFAGLKISNTNIIDISYL